MIGTNVGEIKRVGEALAVTCGVGVPGPR